MRKIACKCASLIAFIVFSTSSMASECSAEIDVAARQSLNILIRDIGGKLSVLTQCGPANPGVNTALTILGQGKSASLGPGVVDAKWLGSDLLLVKRAKENSSPLKFAYEMVSPFGLGSPRALDLPSLRSVVTASDIGAIAGIGVDARGGGRISMYRLVGDVGLQSMKMPAIAAGERIAFIAMASKAEKFAVTLARSAGSKGSMSTYLYGADGQRLAKVAMDDLRPLFFWNGNLIAATSQQDVVACRLDGVCAALSEAFRGWSVVSAVAAGEHLGLFVLRQNNFERLDIMRGSRVVLLNLASGIIQGDVVLAGELRSLGVEWVK